MQEGLRSRRHFLHGALSMVGVGLMSGCGLTSPLGLSTAKTRRVGILGLGNPASPPSGFIVELLTVLQELGWTEGENIAFERRHSQREEDMPTLAAELVAMPVELIIAETTGAAAAAKQATNAIPIVMVATADADQLGLIESLAHPGGNVTGLTNPNIELFPKRLQLLKEVVAGASRVAVLTDPNWPATGRVVQALQLAAPSLGVRIQEFPVRDPSQYEATFAAMIAADANALQFLGDARSGQDAVQLAELTIRHGLPAMNGYRPFVTAGGLMGHGVNFPDLYRRSAPYVDKVLRGIKPTDLPVERPAKYDFVLNRRAAQALGLTFPQTVLAQATEIIE